MKISEKKRWDKNRVLFLEIGLFMSLCIVVTLMNWETFPKEINPYENQPKFELEELPIEIVHQPKSKTKSIRDLSNIEIVYDSENQKDEIKWVENQVEPSLLSPHRFQTKNIQQTRLPLPDYPQDEIILDEKAEDKVFNYAERMPLFGNCAYETYEENKKCSDKQMLQYLAKQIKYPLLAKNTGIEGKVIVEFTITPTGQIRGIKILRDIGGGCGQEVLRVIENMPSWTPGMQNDRAVSVMVRVPVTFEIKN